MAKTRKKSPVAGPGGSRRTAVAVAILLLGGGVVAFLATREKPSTRLVSSPPAPSSPLTASQGQPQPRSSTDTKPPGELLSMEVAQAVMVTVELDFGPKIPGIPEALREVERRYAPDDGVGRTFAILDAYGEPTPDRKLHISMHVSSEKPGTGSLIFRRTGEVLWQSKILPATRPPSSPFAGRNLGITLDDGAGRSFSVDGSNNPSSILEAKVKDLGKPVGAIWPDGAEREVTFIYSMCGCPVKVMARRVGARTVRTKELPVIFPDDPAVVSTINRLMGW